MPPHTTLARTLPILILVCSGAAASVPAATYTVTGVVKNEAGQGLGGVDLAFVEYCSGTAVFLPNHTTLANGTFSIVVNEGTYNIQLTPSTGSILAATETGDLPIHADTNLGTIVLHPGIRIAGTVKNQAGTGLSGINLDFVDLATGNKIFVSSDVTGTGGTYSVRVPTGTYDIEYRPSSSTAYVTGLRESVVATSDVTGLVDTLVTGLRVFGNVQTQSGVSVVKSDLNFYDTCAGVTIPTAHDNSDSSGNFSVYVPTGTYTITFSPPRCSSLGSARIPSQPVSADTDLGVYALPDSFPVSGRILDPMVQPVVRADLKFYDASSGDRQAASSSHTDTAGRFSIYVPPGDYNINVLPPPNEDLLVERVPVSVAGATGVGDVTLSVGLRLSGTVLGPGNAGARGVNVNVVDSATRTALRLANDTTAADGSFAVVVPAGTYDVQYAPPACSPLAPADQKTVSVSSSLILPAVHLVPGVHASGSVVDTLGSGVANLDLDFFPAGTRSKTYTPKDNTSSSGAYDVIVPPGVYDIDYVPPAGSSLRAVQRFGVVLSADTTIPTVVLHQGLSVSGFVYADATGMPVASVSLAFYPPGGGAALFTPRNTSGADGGYDVLVDSGTWDILYTPPAETGLAPRWRRGVAVSSDVVLPPTYLLPLTVPVVASFSPSSGSTRGGQAITVNGSGFQPDATVKLGGVSAKNVTYASSTTLNATTPPHPPGPAGEVVENPGQRTGTGPMTFLFVEPANPVNLTVARSGGSIVLSWPATGQGSYTVFRDTSPVQWSDASIATTTPSTTYMEAVGAPSPGVVFYNVD